MLDYRLLYELAREYGIQTVFYDYSRKRRRASPETILAVLKELGAPLDKPEGAGAALREKTQSRGQRLLEPVIVAWGGAAAIRVRLPAGLSDLPLSAEVELENGDRRAWSSESLPAIGSSGIADSAGLLKWLALPEKLPYGYHRLRVSAGNRSGEAMIISAPLKAFSPEEERVWGTFMPLYALHSRRSWGAGDFSDLANLVDWVAGLGGGVVSTLPFLAAFLDEPFAPSPYTPASRLMWNEFYLDINAVPELDNCPAAKEMLASPAFVSGIEKLRAEPLVNYRWQMALKRKALEALCQCLSPERARLLGDFVKANPAVEDYARFRAAVEKQGEPWRSWRSPLRDGRLSEGDWDEEARRRHLYAQWLAREQVQAAAEHARKKGVRLYLDLPLGVHPDGYDTWREQSVFAAGASVGAPPDLMFTAGQDWGFPPLHPERVRQSGYGYVIAYLRHQMKYGGILRIDHVMGLHRLYWIPAGMEKRDGVYVRYHADELYAILALESHRHRCVIVGEDLGTVPPEVRPAMSRHGLHRMYVAEYELLSPSSIAPVSRSSVASLETHDMPPFAAFWKGQDIERRLKLGLLDRMSALVEEKKRREVREGLTAYLKEKGWLTATPPDTSAALDACLSFLAASRGRVLLVNLEDLWLETEPQNIPSTDEAYPNWRRRARYAFEDFCQMPRITGTLQGIADLRRRNDARRKNRADAADRG